MRGGYYVLDLFEIFQTDVLYFNEDNETELTDEQLSNFEKFKDMIIEHSNCITLKKPLLMNVPAINTPTWEFDSAIYVNCSRIYKVTDDVYTFEIGLGHESLSGYYSIEELTINFVNKKLTSGLGTIM